MGYSYKWPTNDMKSCENCSNCSKLREVISADYEFELRKLKEDTAAEKVLMEISLHKDIRRWQDKILKEKRDRDEDNRNWLSKFTETDLLHQQNILKIQSQHNIQAHNMQATFASELKTQAQIAEKKLEQRIEQQRRAFESKIEQLTVSYRRAKQQQLAEHQAELTKAIQQFQSKEEIARAEYQSSIQKLKNELKNEEKAHSKSKLEHKNECMLFYRQIHELCTSRTQLQAEISKLKDDRNTVQAQLSCSIKQLQERIEEKEREKEQIHRESRDKLWKKDAEIEEQSRRLLEEQMKMAERYECSLQQIEETRIAETRLNELQIKDIKNCIDSRPSRVEDIEQILAIKQRLAKREKENDLLEHELKLYQLELENKEDTYNKLFIPNVNAHKKESKLKRAGRSVTTVRDILQPTNHNLPLLDKPRVNKTNKIL